jgi:hypothetical protein
MDDDRDWANSSEYSRQPESTPMNVLAAGGSNRNPSTHHLLPNEERGPVSPALLGERTEYFGAGEKMGGYEAKP